MTSLLQKITSLPLHQQLELIQLIAKGLQERGQKVLPYERQMDKVEIVPPADTYWEDRTDTTI
ncbi:MAG: hypothetical protein R3E32_08010 [Chitinophagales bacterium]